MGNRPKRCATCRFAETDSQMPGHYTCRRHAPVILPAAHELTGKGAESSATWPGVGPDDWCGEWKPRDLEPVDLQGPREVRITLVAPDGTEKVWASGPADPGHDVEESPKA